MAPQNWRTPKAIFTALQGCVPAYWKTSHARFDYDLAAQAATPKGGVVDAIEKATGEVANNLAPFLPSALRGEGPPHHYDTLQSDWAGPNFARPAHYWCNPPWNDVPSFVDKAIEEEARVCFLLPARTDQKWFRRLKRVACIEFFEGRIAFEDPLLSGQWARTTPREGALVAWTFPEGEDPGPSRTMRHNKTGWILLDDNEVTA